MPADDGTMKLSEKSRFSGKQILHYTILEELGSGGMGSVYKAEDTKLKRLVAIKFLLPHLSRDEQAKARFLLEARAASALDHTNICNIYEINETEEGQMFIVMAYYGKDTLRDRLRKGALEVNEAVGFAVRIARGLGTAHAKGIIHRDIKPANIAITDNGEIKIVDFGIAKLAGGTMLTQEGARIGTVAYMSPEQSQGRHVDQRTDIWALGVVLYEMLTGRCPFRGEYHASVLYSIMNDEPESIHTINASVPRELERIVGKALEKDPVERYQSAEELQQDLEHFLDGKKPPRPRRHKPVLSRLRKLGRFSHSDASGHPLHSEYGRRKGPHRRLE